MIALPRWVRDGLTWVLALYSEVLAVATLPSSARPDLDLVALVVFVAATAALWTSHFLGRAVRVAEGAAIAACAVVIVLVPAGLDPVASSYSSGAWHVTAVTCVAVVLLLRTRRWQAVLLIGALAVQTLLWAGFGGLIEFGVAAVVLLIAVAAVSAAAFERTRHDMARYLAVEQEAVEWRALHDAFHLERQTRLVRTGRTASAMLQRIVDTDGVLSPEDRQECRVLEQTLRDEIRGRHLLTDGLRDAVLTARRRGAFVQVLDDGGLDDAEPAVLGPVLQQVADAVAGVASDRIVVRTARRGADTVVTVAATSPDPVAAALGLDEEDGIDLWLELPVPAGR